jgi:hypothetical protein
LTLPEALSAMRVSACIEGSDVLRDVHLIMSYCHLCAPLEFILEPGIWNSQIEITCDFDWRVSPEEDLPMIINCFKDRCEVDVDL